MPLNPEVARQIEEIRQDRVHGASWLSRQAIGVMNLAVEESEARNVADFLEELKVVGRGLMEARPSMASITNCVSRFVYQVSQESETKKDLGSLKKLARSKGNELIKDVEEAFFKATEQGAEVIEEGDSLMTCSYSSTICQTLEVAKQAGKEFHVLVAESRSSSGQAYGEMTIEQLKVYGIPTEVIPDKTIKQYISKVRKVLVGADSILADGSLINGTPTYMVALALKESQIPLYALCETAKFDVRSYLGQQPELEEGFDRVPPHLITGIITEEGIIKPSEVMDYIEQRARYVQILLPK
jgi:translation initiation factor 2B subunit (eIF-2B alpha/beta/delta family)